MKKEKYVKERGKTIEFVSFEICLSLREAEKKVHPLMARPLRGG